MCANEIWIKNIQISGKYCMVIRIHRFFRLAKIMTCNNNSCVVHDKLSYKNLVRRQFRKIILP